MRVVRRWRGLFVNHVDFIQVFLTIFACVHIQMHVNACAIDACGPPRGGPELYIYIYGVKTCTVTYSAFEQRDSSHAFHVWWHRCWLGLETFGDSSRWGVCVFMSWCKFSVCACPYGFLPRHLSRFVFPFSPFATQNSRLCISLCTCPVLVMRQNNNCHVPKISHTCNLPLICFDWFRYVVNWLEYIICLQVCLSVYVSTSSRPLSTSLRVCVCVRACVRACVRVKKHTCTVTFFKTLDPSTHCR